MAESLGTAVLDLTTDDSRLRRGLVSAEISTKSSFGNMASGVIRSAASIATAFGAYKLGKALFVDPINMAGNFQQTLKVLQAVTGITGAEMKKLSDRAIRLGADVKLPATSAQDAADAMLALGKAGMSAGQIMGSIHAVLLLSAAAEISNADAADMVTKAMGAFGLKAKDAKVIVDDLAGAANASQSSIQDVGAAMTMSGAAFKSARVPIGDAATAIALMAKHGITGSMAGSALNQAFLRLGNPTKAMTAQFQAMGVHMFDANGKFVGMRSAIGQLTPKLAGMTDQQRLHALAVLGGSRASKAMQFVLGAGVKEWDKTKAAVERAGQAQDVANAKTSGFKGAMAGLRSTLETLQIQIGLKLLPVLTTFVRWLTAEIPAGVAIATKVIDSIKGAVGDVAAAIQPHIGTMKAAFLGLVGVVKTVASFLSDNIGNLKQFATAIGIAAAVIVTLTTVVKIYTGVQAVLNAVMMANPFTLVIVAIAALVIGLTLLYQRSDTARAIMQGAFAAIKAAADAAFGWITNTVIPAAISAWNRFGPGVVSALSTAAGTIKTVVQGIATAVAAVVDQIKQHWDQIWSVLGPLAKGYLDAARTAIATVLNVIADVIRLFSDLLHGRWGSAWGQLKNIASDALNGVVGVVGSILKGLATSAGNLAKLVGEAIVKGIKWAAQGLAGLAGDLTGKISGAISQVAGWAYTKAREIGFKIADGVISGIGNLAGRLGSAIKDAASGAVSWAGSHLKGSGDFMFTIHAIGEPLVFGIIKGVENIKQKLADTVEGTVRNSMVHGGQAIAKGTEATKAIFDAWAANVKTRVEAVFAQMKVAVDAKFAKAQADLAVWKAKLTPAEAQLALMQAQAAEAAVKLAVTNAEAALAKLKSDFAISWAKLLADQQKNMAALTATWGQAQTNSAIAGHEFDKTAASVIGDPLATNLLNAQKALDSAKALYASGQGNIADLFAAQDAFDAASIAAANDTGAQKLLADYLTWQGLLAQQAVAGTAVTTQQDADWAAQKAALDQHDIDLLAAQTTLGDAQVNMTVYYLGIQAQNERNAHDAQAAGLDTHLTALHNRTLLHIGNVQHAWTLHYDEMVRQADKRGQEMGDAFVTAIGKILTDGSLQTKMTAIGNFVKKYLALNSPAEKGPLSTLDKWWVKFSDTLFAGMDENKMAQRLTNAVTPNMSAGMAGAYASDTTRAKSMTANGAVTLNQTFHQTPANADPVAMGQVTTYAFKNLRT